MSELPQPNENARTVPSLAIAIIDTIPFLGSAIKFYVQKSLDDARELLVSEISDRGIGVLDNLTDVQREFFIPAGYRFFEQARLGEYQHNLRVLACLIGNELRDCDQGDVGKVARTARRLEMISENHLKYIALINSALQEDGSQNETLKRDSISPSFLIEMQQVGERDVPEAIQAFYDLEWRGVITRREGAVFASSPESTSYRLTNSYFEIMEAVSQICKDK